jgi:aquaporin Z
VNYIVTAPGEAGIVAAFVAELVTTFAMMLLVLVATNDRRLHRFTGILVSVLLAALIAFESPVSGTSLNPARSFGSALVARHFTAIWIYFTAPPLGAWLAALLYTKGAGLPVLCAKLNHEKAPAALRHCIFRCAYREIFALAAARSERSEA